MNSANPSTASRTPSNRYPLVLTLTLVLSLLSCNTNKHLIQTQQHQTENHESSITDHSSFIDSIATLVTETIWLPPDTLGKQYPLHTIRRETGQKTESLTNLTMQQRDTLFIETHETSPSPQTQTSVWLPWVTMIIMVIIALIILALRLLFRR